MTFKETKIRGLYIIEPELKIDERGYFTRIFAKDELSKEKLDFDIVHINQSLTKKKGTIRGMHFQKIPKAEDKIVQCLKGVIYEVAVDLRKDSLTYGQWAAEELSENNKRMFLIPKGFAQGFQALTDNCEVQYLMSEFYSPENASGARYDDPFLNITWPIKNPVLSEKDKKWPLINRVKNTL